MTEREEDLDSDHLRQLAGKCRRLAGEMSDTVTVAALRQMAAEYDRLAYSKEEQIPPPRAYGG